MIKVQKSAHVPSSLTTTVAYNGQDEIEQRIDFANKKALFVSNVNDSQHAETVRLLNRVFNGTKRVRTTREERFIEKAISIVNKFYDLIICYLSDPDVSTEKAIKDELSIDKELLGFKYWIIRDTPFYTRLFPKM